MPPRGFPSHWNNYRVRGRDLIEYLGSDARRSSQHISRFPIFDIGTADLIGEPPGFRFGLGEDGSGYSQLGSEIANPALLEGVHAYRNEYGDRHCHQQARAIPWPWLPVEAVTTTFAPRLRACRTAQSAPRSLKLPTGRKDSYLTHTSRSSATESARSGQAGLCTPRSRSIVLAAARTLRSGAPGRRVRLARGGIELAVW